MRIIAATTCSAVVVTTALVACVAARADVRQTPPAPPPDFEVRWSQALEKSPGAISMAAGVTRVFVADSEVGIAAHASADGLLGWTRPLPSSLPPVVAGDQVFVASGGRLYALDEVTGRDRWVRDLGGPAAAVLANGTGAIAAGGRMLRAWSADGLPAWQREFAADVAPALLAVDAGLVYVGLVDQTLTGVDLATGESRWIEKLETLPRGFVAGGGRVYFGGTDQALHAYTRGGGLAWRFPQVDVIGAPALDDRFVYVALWDNTVLKLDRGNGHRTWRADLFGRPVRGPWVKGADVLAPLMTGPIASIAVATGVAAPPTRASADAGRERVLAAAASDSGADIFSAVVLENTSRVLVARRKGK